MSKVPLVLEGSGNPYEDVCALARDVVVERGALRARASDVAIAGVSGSALALRGGVVAASSGSTRGLSWGDVALFLPQWRVVSASGSVDLRALSAPTVARAEAHYPLLLTGLDWMLSGGTVGVNRLPNGDFRQGATGWSVIKGAVQLGWTGTGGYAAWFLGGDGGSPYPGYAGIRSAPFAIDRSKPYSLLFESLCEPYDRYTYDNLPPQIVVRVWQRGSGGRIGSEPLLVYASGEAAHATGARGVWHRHLVFVGAIHPHNGGLSPRWDASATAAEIEVFCNFNKQRVANLRFLEGGLAEWRVAGGRRVGRWVFTPSPEPLSCEVFAGVNWTLTDVWALRFDYVRVYGAESVQDEGLQLVVETESGERYQGRILSYRRKDVAVGSALQSVVYEDVEFDCSMARGQAVRRVGLTFGVSASSSESPVVEIGSPVVDGGGSEVEGFGVYAHGGLGRGSASYYLTEVREVGGGLRLESAPRAVRVELPVHNYHGVRVEGVRANAGTRLRLYRAVGGVYYLVGERATDGAIVDMGGVGEPYVAGGVLPEADMGVVWGGRMVVGKSGERVAWVSGQHAPLLYAETAFRDEDGFTVVCSEPLRAIGAEPEAVVLYGQTRAWRLTRYAPPIVLEDYTVLPDSFRHADWGVVVSRGRVVVRGRVVRELPADFVVGGVRLGQDGSVLVWHATELLAYVLTEDGWARWRLPTVVRDALMVDGRWVVVSEAGCWRLCGGSGRVSGAEWVSGWFAAERMSRPFWVWLRGRATVRARRLGDASAVSKVVEDDRWQVPLGGVARAWRLELGLDAEDVVYGLAVEAEGGEVR